MSSTPAEPHRIITITTRTGASAIVCGAAHVGTTTFIRNLLREQGQV